MARVTYWHITRPQNVDAVVVFQVRHESTQDIFSQDDESVESRYGGLDGNWRIFKGMELLDLNFEGVLMVPGPQWMQCRGDAWDRYMEWMDRCVKGS